MRSVFHTGMYFHTQLINYTMVICFIPLSNFIPWWCVSYTKYFHTTWYGGEERIEESLSATRAQYLPVHMRHCSRMDFRFPIGGEGSSRGGGRFLVCHETPPMMGAPAASNVSWTVHRWVPWQDWYWGMLEGSVLHCPKQPLSGRRSGSTDSP